jgi:hypothetical protein
MVVDTTIRSRGRPRFVPTSGDCQFGRPALRAAAKRRARSAIAAASRGPGPALHRASWSRATATGRATAGRPRQGRCPRCGRSGSAQLYMRPSTANRQRCHCDGQPPQKKTKSRVSVTLVFVFVAIMHRPFVANWSMGHIEDPGRRPSRPGSSECLRRRRLGPFRVGDGFCRRERRKHIQLASRSRERRQIQVSRAVRPRTPRCPRFPRSTR